MNESLIFLDTYAMIELFRGNSAYAAFRDMRGILTKFNLAEFNHALKKELPENQADIETSYFTDLLVDVSPQEIMEAMSLKRKNKDLSIPDAIGYTVAKKRGVLFLTGDSDFKNIDGVIFLK